jgi:CPA1 family monovalent cation:H+ antiporter
MSETTRQNIDKFWELIDEILNAVLFVIIGLEIIAVRLSARVLGPAVAAILIVLASRLASVAFSSALLRGKRRLGRGSVVLLTWGGLRGGISIALALSLPPGPERPLILAATYVVVIFSVIVQGLTISRMTARLAPRVPE